MIYPMFALIVLTTIVGVITVVTRYKSVRSGAVKIKYYRLMRGDEPPEFVTRTTRCANNLFEVPILFYVVCTLLVSLQIDNLLTQILAWGFVVFRTVQAYIHLTYNNVLHRMYVFWLGFVMVFALWVVLLLEH